MMRPRIFITQPVAMSAIARLRAVADVEMNPDSSRIIAKGALVEALREHDLLFSLLHDKIDRDVIAANPKLRAVASMSITPDNIDIAEATARRIPVTVVPPIVAEATADINFGLMPPIEGPKTKKADRKRLYTDRAREALRDWMTSVPPHDGVVGRGTVAQSATVEG